MCGGGAYVGAERETLTRGYCLLGMSATHPGRDTAGRGIDRAAVNRLSKV
jgi:hypothetical protein